ncbi:MAG: UvrB/UvrC motif-containing protein [bacterium]
MNNPLATLPQIFSNFLAELVGDDFLRTNIDETGKKCSGCGSTWRNFQKTGLFGCDICYQTFEDDLNLILRRIHGSNQHIGSRPKSIRHEIDRAELDKMKIELENAIKLEKFERAAELRDLIRDAQDNLEIKDDDGILR